MADAGDDRSLPEGMQYLHEAMVQKNPAYARFVRSLLARERGFLEQILAEMREHFHSAYVRAGAPYGPDDNGFWRWLIQHGARRRLLQVTVRLEDRPELLDALREKYAGDKRN